MFCREYSNPANRFASPSNFDKDNESTNRHWPLVENARVFPRVVKAKPLLEGTNVGLKHVEPRKKPDPTFHEILDG